MGLYRWDVVRRIILFRVVPKVCNTLVQIHMLSLHTSLTMLHLSGSESYMGYYTPGVLPSLILGLM